MAQKGMSARMREASFLLIAMPKWRHFAQVNIAYIFMLSSKLPKQNETKSINLLAGLWPTQANSTLQKAKKLDAGYPESNEDS